MLLSCALNLNVLLFIATLDGETVRITDSANNVPCLGGVWETSSQVKPAEVFYSLSLK